MVSDGAAAQDADIEVARGLEAKSRRGQTGNRAQLAEERGRGGLLLLRRHNHGRRGEAGGEQERDRQEYQPARESCPQDGPRSSGNDEERTEKTGLQRLRGRTSRVAPNGIGGGSRTCFHWQKIPRVRFLVTGRRPCACYLRRAEARMAG